MNDLTPLHQPAETPTFERSQARASVFLVVPAGLAVAAAVTILCVTSYGAYLYVPVDDVIAWAWRVFQAEGARQWIGYLWAPHTAQRIPIARLVELVDVELARGTWPTFLVATAIAWLTGCACLALLLSRSRVSSRTKMWLGAAAALLLANVALAEDFAFPVFSVYLFVAGPALASAALLPTSSLLGLKSVAFWAALALAVIASQGNAAGLAIWPALLAGAAMQSRGRDQVWAILLVAVICGVTTEAGLGVPSTSLDRESASAAAHALKMAIYLCVFGGLPWSRTIHPLGLAAAVGALLWIFALHTAVRAQPSRGDTASPLTATGAILIVFGLITALLATFGRVDELPQPVVPTRYTPFAVLLQLGVLLGCARTLDSPKIRAWAVNAVFAIFVVLMLSADLHGGRLLLRTAVRIRAASDRFDRTGQQDEMLIYPDAAYGLAVRRALAARGLPH